MHDNASFVGTYAGLPEPYSELLRALDHAADVEKRRTKVELVFPESNARSFKQCPAWFQTHDATRISSGNGRTLSTMR
jgi:CTP synthase (UTP-ammonia lyase)